MSTTYNGCTYEGGFRALKGNKAMKPGGDARVDLDDKRFSLRRPRVLFSGATRHLWAPWARVTALDIETADEGSRLQITTERQGTGAVMIPEVTPEELWEVLDEFADLKERFHDAAAALRADDGDAENEATS